MVLPTRIIVRMLRSVLRSVFVLVMCWSRGARPANIMSRTTSMLQGEDLHSKIVTSTFWRMYS